MRRTTTVALASLLSLAPAAATLACPYCKESIPSSEAQAAGALPGGFNLSVYFMLVAFGVIMCSVVGVIVKSVRQTNATTVLPPSGFEPVTKDRNDPPTMPPAGN
jgi:hypothetical protein